MKDKPKAFEYIYGCSSLNGLPYKELSDEVTDKAEALEYKKKVLMKVKFWGVRGSVPTPLTSTQLREKIALVVQRTTPKDLKDPAHRRAFLSSLPPSIIGTVGGNTTCIGVTLEDGTWIIIDAGTGIRELGYDLQKRKITNSDFHILFTHFHWDHIQGLPFFIPAYIPGNRLYFYSTDPRCQEYLENQMKNPHFPIDLASMGAKKEFISLPKKEFSIGGATVSWRKMNHPGGSISYKFVEGKSKFIFSTDTELGEENFLKTQENRQFYEGTDLLVMDSQYTLDEAIEKYDWGHSAFSLAVDFAVAWEIPKLVLFHHEPKHDDAKIYGMHKRAKDYLGHQHYKNIEIFLATEMLEISL